MLVGQAMGESLGVGNRGWDFSEGLGERWVLGTLDRIPGHPGGCQ